MKHDLVIKILLVVILVLLTVNLIRPLVSPLATHAAPSIQYKVVSLTELEDTVPPRTPTEQGGPFVESLLNKYGNKGWKLVIGPGVGFPFFIFTK